MKDLLYFIYYSVLGLFGLFCFGLMLIGYVLYYPIWRINRKKEIEEKYPKYSF